MRLLNTRTKEFVLIQDPRTVHYAILSHVWSKPDSPDYVPEQTYQDVCRIQVANRRNIINPSFPPSSGEGRVPSSAESTPLSTDGESTPLQLSDKIRRFCEAALADGFELAWADTCCIDHTNPSELTEAIASMYDWYSYAKACYVFLSDVSDRDRDAGSGEAWETEFRESEWFCRGWTLQELLAPNVVIFFSKNWEVLGSKHELAPLVERITSIERAIIRREKPLDAVSVACRMSWAASRETTREEDRAYSMLGIFGVNIRIVYGEGSYAFYRLQEAIINEIPDQTIFAWQLRPPQAGLLPRAFSRPFSHPSDGHPPAPSSTPEFETATKPPKQLPKLPVNALYHSRQYLLANSPDDFQGSSDIIPLSREEFVKTLGVAPADAIQIFKSTAYGMSARLPLVEFTPSSGPSDSTIYLALLACRFGESRTLVALLLRPHDDVPSAQASEYIVGRMLGPHSETPPTPSDLHSSSPSPSTDRFYVRATVLSPEQLKKCRSTFQHAEVLIANRPSRAQYKLERDIPLYRALAPTDEIFQFQVQLCGWSSRLLNQQGYTTFPRDLPNGIVTLKPRILLEDVAIHFGIIRDGGPHLEVQVGRLCIDNARALGIAVRCGGDMKLADGFSDLTDTHYSHISSWTRQGGAATKELGLAFPSAEELTLRLVFTHEPSDAGCGAAGGTTVYRLGAEIFHTQSHFPPSPSSHFPTPPSTSAPGGTARHLPVVSMRSRQSGGSSHAPNAHPAPQLAREVHHAHHATTESSSTDRRRRNVASPRR